MSLRSTLDLRASAALGQTAFGGRLAPACPSRPNHRAPRVVALRAGLTRFARWPAARALPAQRAKLPRWAGFRAARGGFRAARGFALRAGLPRSARWFPCSARSCRAPHGFSPDAQTRYDTRGAPETSTLAREERRGRSTTSAALTRHHRRHKTRTRGHPALPPAHRSIAPTHRAPRGVAAPHGSSPLPSPHERQALPNTPLPPPHAASPGGGGDPGARPSTFRTVSGSCCRPTCRRPWFPGRGNRPG
jgi:hypothetical protein